MLDTRVRDIINKERYRASNTTNESFATICKWNVLNTWQVAGDTIKVLFAIKCCYTRIHSGYVVYGPFNNIN